MTSLQIGLIIGGIALVVAVVVYNWLQERRIRRKIRSGSVDRRGTDAPARGNRGGRVEPTLSSTARGDSDELSTHVHAGTSAASGPRLEEAGLQEDVDDFVSPVEVIAHDDASAAEAEPSHIPAMPDGASSLALRTGAPDKSLQPDPDAECIITLQPVRPVTAGALAAGLHARVGKRLRWLGRAGPSAPWQLLHSDTPGQLSEIAACLLLADRAGALTPPMMERFLRLVSDVASSLPAAFVAPDGRNEIARAEALDRICADLDVQIGLTVLKPSPGTIAGTRLRGVAEAAGFRLTDNGRFDWVQEETGCVLYSLQNYRSEPFTVDSLRLTSTPGAVFILDVPRVSDPVRVFDQMKLAAKRMVITLDADLVDDNRRPLDDAALAAIRQQVQATAAALKEIHVVPGSPRALALFGG